MLSVKSIYVVDSLLLLGASDPILAKLSLDSLKVGWLRAWRWCCLRLAFWGFSIFLASRGVQTQFFRNLSRQVEMVLFLFHYLRHIWRPHINRYVGTFIRHQVSISVVNAIHFIRCVIWISLEVFFTCQAFVLSSKYKWPLNSLATEFL